MDCRWTASRIHLWVKNMQTHVKLFCCGSAQIIVKNDFQQITIFYDTKQNLRIKISGLKNRILLWETATFPGKSVSTLSHAFGRGNLIFHTTEFTRWDANCYFFYLFSLLFVCETLHLEHISGKTKLERFNKIYLIRKLVKYKRDNNQLKNIYMD